MTQLSPPSKDDIPGLTRREVKCPHCGGPATLETLDVVGAARLQNMICPRCDPEKERRLAEIKKQQEKQSRLDRRNQLARTAGVPPRFYKSDESNFEADTPEKAAVLKQALAVIDDLRGDFKTTGVIFCGPVGVGKTHLGVAIMKAAINNLLSARYVTASALCRTIKAFWKKEKAEDPMIEWVKPRVLFIDELALDSDEKDRRILAEIIDQRWSKQGCTIVATNQTNAELTAQIGRPAFDRLAHDGRCIMFPGSMPSYRTGMTATENQD